MDLRYIESPPRLFHEMKSIRDYEEFTSVEPTSDNSEDQKDVLATDEEFVGVSETEEETVDFKSEPICDASELETDPPSESKHDVDDLLLAVETRIKEEVDDTADVEEDQNQMNPDHDLHEEEEVKCEDTGVVDRLTDDGRTESIELPPQSDGKVKCPWCGKMLVRELSDMMFAEF